MFTEADAGLQASPEPRHGVDNVFFALIPPDEAGQQAIALQGRSLQQLGSRPTLVPKDCLHVSLLDIAIRKNLSKRHIGQTIADARAAAGGLRFNSFDVQFDRAMSFGEKATPIPFVLQMGEGREQVALLCKKLNLCLASAGVHADNKATTPHITLARALQNIPLLDVEPIRWRADRLVLVHSVVGQTRHIYLQSWPLHSV